MPHWYISNQGTGGLRDENVPSNCGRIFFQGEPITKEIAMWEGNEPVISGGWMTNFKIWKRTFTDQMGDRGARVDFSMVPCSSDAYRSQVGNNTEQSGVDEHRPRWTEACHLVPRGSSDSPPAGRDLWELKLGCATSCSISRQYRPQNFVCCIPISKVGNSHVRSCMDQREPICESELPSGPTI